MRPNATESIYRSKAVGEPPFMHGIAVYCAILDAVHACSTRGHPNLSSPATPEAILRAIGTLG
jgi:xanthine dehydrogenase large subunit